MYIDTSTGIELTPSLHGNDCLGNGEHEGYECCCDECDYYLECFPEIREMLEQHREERRKRNNK